MNTTPLLPNFLAGRWQDGAGHAATLHDPVLGTPLVRVSSAGLDLAAGFAFAREQGGKALRALSYGERAGLLAAIDLCGQVGEQGVEGVLAGRGGRGRHHGGGLSQEGWLGRAPTRHLPRKMIALQDCVTCSILLASQR